MSADVSETASSVPWRSRIVPRRCRNLGLDQLLAGSSVDELGAVEHTQLKRAGPREQQQREKAREEKSDATLDERHWR